MRALMVVALFLLPAAAAAKSEQIGGGRTFGLGLAFGEPYGFSGKLWLNREMAATFTLGSSITRPGILLAGDLAFHMRDMAPQTQSVELGVYFGGGAATGFWRHEDTHRHDDPWPHEHRHTVYDYRLAVRGVAGGALWLRKIPLEFTAEIGPAFEILPEVRFFFSGGIAGRYYF